MKTEERLKEALRLLEDLSRNVRKLMNDPAIADAVEKAIAFFDRTAPRHWPEIPPNQDMVFVDACGRLCLRSGKTAYVYMCYVPGRETTWAKAGSAVAAQFWRNEQNKATELEHINACGRRVNEWLAWGGWK